MLWTTTILALALEQECGVVKDVYKTTCCGENGTTLVTIPPPPPPAAVQTFEQVLAMQTAAGAQAAATVEPPVASWPWTEGPTTRTDSRPNVITVLFDDAGYNEFSFMNKNLRATDSTAAPPVMQTPNIDRVANTGILGSRAYAAAASCSPSRASIMTGRYGYKMGFEGTAVPFGMYQLSSVGFARDEKNPLPTIDMATAQALPPVSSMALPTKYATIGTTLQDAGYYTAYIGKWHLGLDGDYHPNNRGFDDAMLLGDASKSGIGYCTVAMNANNECVLYTNPDDWLESYLGSVAGQTAFVTFNGGNDTSVSKYVTDYYTDNALEVIEKNKNRPFYLQLAHWGPHTPLQATRADYDLFAYEEDEPTRIHKAMLYALDRSMKRIYDKLDALGLTDNTMIVITSDNGQAQYPGFANAKSPNFPYRGFKLTPLEGGLRVPFAVSFPNGNIPAGETRDEMMHGIDLLPTIAAVAGATPPAGLDGVNLLPYLQNGSHAAPHTNLFFKNGDVDVIMTKTHKMITNTNTDPAVGGGDKWLFDMETDKHETTNLYTSDSTSAASIESQLQPIREEFLTESVDLLWDFAMSSWVGVDGELFWFSN